MNVSESLLCTLASKISTNASKIDKHLKENGKPSPSFSADGLERYPDEVQLPRLQLLEAAMDIYNLASEPGEYLTWQGLCVSECPRGNMSGTYLTSLKVKHDVMVLGILNEFNFWDAVPLDGSATYSETASKTNLPESMARRILRHAMTQHIFDETEPGSGRVKHTVNSAFAVRHPLVRSWLGHNLEEVGACCPRLPEVLHTVGETPESAECPLMQMLDPTAPKHRNFFDFAAVDGEGEKKGWRMARFGGAMAHISSSGGADFEPLMAAFDWDALGEATVVDVGGAAGHDSIKLAAAHPNLRCIVQDFERLHADFQAACPPELKCRVSFQAHNFWEEQPVKGADVYMFKRILHDYSHKYASKILAQIVPAMKPGSRIIVMDGLLPPRGAMPWYLERLLCESRSADVRCADRERKNQRGLGGAVEERRQEVRIEECGSSREISQFGY
jgi:hypothetical protein